MKQPFRKYAGRMAAIVLAGCICGHAAAQDSTGVGAGSSWYSQTALWLVGGSITALVIIALIRRGTNKKEIK